MHSGRSFQLVVSILILVLVPGISFPQATDPSPAEPGSPDIAATQDDQPDAGSPEAGAEGESNAITPLRYLRDALRLSLEALHGLTGSWPAALILLSVGVRALFLPLTVYTTRHQVAMGRTMDALKPKIDALTKQFGEDVEGRDEAILALQKRHGVSPLSQLQGCLPLMIQIPILIALFQEILSFEPIRGVPFLWMEDLTKPDALYAVGSSIPWFGDSLNLLPVLLFGSHVVIGWLSADRRFTRSMLAMPAVIALLFYPFPAGALVYWVTGSVIQVLETVVIRRGLSAQSVAGPR